MTNMEKIQLCREIVDQIQAESRRPVCRLRPSREPFGIADSHLGGAPYLPRDVSYPMGADGQPLWLCAQINFAQVPPMEGFPQKGILQFFLSDWRYDGCFGLDSGEDQTAQDQWRVCYYPNVDETVTEAECRAKMPIPWEQATIENMGRPQNPLDKDSLKYAKELGTPREKAIQLWRCPDVPLKLNFLPAQAEGASYTDFRFQGLFAAALDTRLPGRNAREFMPYELDSQTPEEREVLDQIYKQIALGGCKMGGYPEFVQDDPRLYGGELPAWDTLLFQLDDVDSGEDLALSGGTLNFFIRSKDLINRDFSRVLAQWATS